MSWFIALGYMYLMSLVKPVCGAAHLRDKCPFPPLCELFWSGWMEKVSEYNIDYCSPRQQRWFISNRSCATLMTMALEEK